MKKIASSIVLLAALSMGLPSCSGDFLNVTPAGSVNSETLSTQDGVEMVLTDIYAKLLCRDNDDSYFRSTLSNYVYGDIMGGEANKGSSSSDQPPFTNLETYLITTDNTYLQTKWSHMYDGVYRVNNLMNLAAGIKDQLSAIQGEQKDYYTELIAQCRFLRALYTFEVVKLFGAAVPYVDEVAEAASVNPMISNVDDSGNYIYIWDKIEADLQYAVDNLPEKWSTDYSKANKWAADALLAKVEMFQASPYNGGNGAGKTELWKDVRTRLEDIIANGTDSQGNKYKLADNYEELYTAGESDWTGESVFDMQASIDGTETNSNTIDGGPHIAPRAGTGNNGWGFYLPSYEMANSFIVDDKGLPLLDKSYQQKPTLSTINGNNVSTDLTVYTDPRLDFAIGRFDIPYYDYGFPTTEWIREPANDGPYFNKKNIGKFSDAGTYRVSTSAGSTAKNFHYIRFADVLLWYAEALIETGDYKAAMEPINEVRARAANAYVHAAEIPTMGTVDEIASNYVLDDLVNGKTDKNAAANYRIGLYTADQFSSADKAMQALRFERKLEMSLEGHQWYDLARWGIVGEELTSYLNFEKKYLLKFATSSYNANWVMMPIPQTEINVMQGVLHQNEVWK
ncbi:MAG: RagB/SusD family nutrient uptake outer membrane protein [Tannerella sp.]|jgi:hypothetical protein|nr:RagB/SusD family nutrient uptake outer membrane protein [Tannerella sp.]